MQMDTVVPYPGGDIDLIMQIVISSGIVQLKFIVSFHGIAAFSVSIIAEKWLFINKNSATRRNAPYIPMPKGRGFTAHLIKQPRGHLWPFLPLLHSNGVI